MRYRAILPPLLGLLMAAVPAMAAEWNTPESRARWSEVGAALVGADVAIGKTDRLVQIAAPATAQEAALVPVTVTLAPEVSRKAFSLVIDQNPVPLAAKVAFGPAGDARQMSFRVRVDGFTNIHAVVEGTDGGLVRNAVFVKAAGGCSAPMGMSATEAMAGIGEMRMKFGTHAGFDDAPQATLMIRHPNFNGMQKDPATRGYTPARFIRAITVTRGPERVFTMTSDISLSTNPVIEFLYRAGGDAPFTVTAVDTEGARWTQTFAPPQTMN